MTEPTSPGKADANRRVEKFAKAFTDAAAAGENVVKVVAEFMDVINHEQDGLISAIDDLSDEIRGLREDLRAMAKERGLGDILGRLIR